jgi:aryl-alcohol dehydrogenase-like predicted oxidoreductase
MGSFMAPAAAPQTELAKPRVLSPNAGLKVSPLCLGAMSIGSAWKEFMGSMDKDQSFKLLDAFYEAGGNFIDTSNNYQDDDSETWVGAWMKERNNRDQMVVATKYTTNYKAYQLGKNTKAINYTGNSRKSMHLSVRDSLKKLQTDYIDILYAPRATPLPKPH